MDWRTFFGQGTKTPRSEFVLAGKSTGSEGFAGSTGLGLGLEVGLTWGGPSCSWGWWRTWDFFLFLLYHRFNFKITTFCASVRNTWIKIKWQLEILWQTCHGGTPHQMYYAITKKREKIERFLFWNLFSRKCVLFWFHGKFIIVSKIDFEFVSITLDYHKTSVVTYINKSTLNQNIVVGS